MKIKFNLVDILRIKDIKNESILTSLNNALFVYDNKIIPIINPDSKGNVIFIYYNSTIGYIGQINNISNKISKSISIDEKELVNTQNISQKFPKYRKKKIKVANINRYKETYLIIERENTALIIEKGFIDAVLNNKKELLLISFKNNVVFKINKIKKVYSIPANNVIKTKKKLTIDNISFDIYICNDKSCFLITEININTFFKKEKLNLKAYLNLNYKLEKDTLIFISKIKEKGFNIFLEKDLNNKNLLLFYNYYKNIIIKQEKINYKNKTLLII